jgi:pimeloyl-ACP methyl ester carboxylesterase
MPASFVAAQDQALGAYGVKAESRMVRSAAGPAHVLVCGSGPAVVMVHGLGAPSALWAPLLALLADFTVYAVDLPGHGLTPPTRPGPTPQTLRRAMTKFLQGTLDQLPMPAGVPVVGNSLGSLCSTWLGLEDPVRVGALVHVGCPALIAGASAPLPMRLGSVGGIGPLLLKLRRATRAQMQALALSLGDSLRDHPALSDLLVAQDAIPGYKESLRDLSRSLVRIRGARPEPSLTTHQLAEVRQPVQLVWGDHDPFGPLDVARRAAAALPDVRLQIIQGGHAPWLTSADQVAAPVRDFLGESAARISPKPTDTLDAPAST